MKLHCDAHMVEFVYNDIRNDARLYGSMYASAMEARNAYGRISARSLAKGDINDALTFAFLFIVADAYIREFSDMASARRR